MARRSISPAFFALAELDCRRSRWQSALEHLDRSLRVNVEHSKARNLAAIVLHKLGRSDAAVQQLREVLRVDPLDATAQRLSGQRIPGDAQSTNQNGWRLLRWIRAGN